MLDPALQGRVRQHQDGDDDNGSYDLETNGDLMSYKNDTNGWNLFEDFRDQHLVNLMGRDTTKNADADTFLFYSCISA